MVIDTDGSAFITKAEFDSLKNNFQAQIDNYNNSIDSKIDGAIAAYLAGIKVAQSATLYYSPEEDFTFINDVTESEFKADQGMMSLNQVRIARCDGVRSIDRVGGTWEHPLKRYLNTTWKSSNTTYDAWQTANPVWSDSVGSGTYNMTLDFGADWASICVLPGYIFSSGDEQFAVLKEISLGLGGTDLKIAGSAWAPLVLTTFAVNYIKEGTTGLGTKSGPTSALKNIPTTKGKNLGDPSPATASEVVCGIYHLTDEDTFGVGYLVSKSAGKTYIKQRNKKISLYNLIETHVYTYQNRCSDSYFHQDTAWADDGAGLEVTISPAANLELQEENLRIPLTESGTINKFYTSLRPTKITETDSQSWTQNHQIGTNNYITSMKCFDESCPIAIGPENYIVSPTNDFNRVGYYLDGSDNLVTKPDCVVKTGKLTYSKLCWASEDLEPKTIIQENLTNRCSETTYLGGGVPLCQTPTETTGSKVKLHYKVTKLDGTPIDSAAGDIPIKITLSNKQFVNGNLASGAANRGELTATVNSSSPEGDWTSTPFAMGIKEKLWLNAYAGKQGYNVVISNIDVS